MKQKIDWRLKLSSRKFWAAIAAVIIALGPLLQIEQATSEQIVTVVLAVGALVAYILAEGYVDGKRLEGENEEK